MANASPLVISWVNRWKLSIPMVVFVWTGPLAILEGEIGGGSRVLGLRRIHLHLRPGMVKAEPLSRNQSTGEGDGRGGPLLDRGNTEGGFCGSIDATTAAQAFH